ncbi:MAG TPA: SprT-like domain-containing protein [Candidatus Binatia bacterium]|jgi:predicted SprT family Zn-dependent metalloprotease
MPPADDALTPAARRQLDRWLRHWGADSLVGALKVEFSPRLRRAFGRCYQQQKIIRLTASLRDSQSHLFEEILCHEAAHAAVYELHGDAARPHGEQWEELMRVAGFEPRVRIPVVVRTVRGRDGSRALYLHRCPVCDRARSASRPMRHWRCRACATSGRDGRLVIQRGSQRPRRERQAAAIGKHRKRRSVISSKRRG